MEEAEAAAPGSTLAGELAALVGADAVLDGPIPSTAATRPRREGSRGAPTPSRSRATATRSRGRRLVLRARRADTPRGGGTGFAGGAVPVDGGLVLALDRLDRVRAFEPLLWRMHVEAGVRTGHVHRLARESGLFFPPDPGAAEQSQIGGNIATNAGGPHAFKYGVTGRWVTGLEAVVPPGELITVGGPIRKDVAGYDLKSLLIGSEGTLGIVTAAWLRLIPAPEAAYPVVALYRDTAAGCAAIERVVGSGLVPAALEYLDGGALAAAGGAFPGGVPAGAGFMVIAEADGTASEAERLRDELVDVLGDAVRAVHGRRSSPTSGAGARASPSPSSRCAAASRARTSSCRSTGSPRRSRRRSRSAAPRSRRLQLGPRGRRQRARDFVVDPRDEAELERARAGARGAVRDGDPPRRLDLRASTASAGRSAAGSSASGRRARSNCTRRSSACSTRRACSPTRPRSSRG